jgi:hypothetical protein
LTQAGTVIIQLDAGAGIRPITGNDGKVVKAGYLEAATLAAAKGLRLPSNVLHDDILVYSEKWVGLSTGYCAAWAREIIAYPEKDRMWFAGKDIVDSETGWTLEAKYVSMQARGVKGAGLFIDPKEVKEENGRVVVIPKTIIVLTNMIRESGTAGKVDPNTRIPLQVDDQSLAKLSEKEKRWFYRIDGMGVRPVVRDNALKGKRSINCNIDPGPEFGVGGV